MSGIANSLDYNFNDPNLLTLALTHRSVGPENNERLEFLGDGALNFVVAHLLYERFPTLPEGELSRLRALLVKEGSLCEIARRLELGQYLLLGDGEKKSAGWRRPSILADAVEAMIGAAYLDGGFFAAQTLVKQFLGAQIQQLDPSEIHKDAKSRLQELLQSKKKPLPDYQVIDMQGEAHAQRFIVMCEVAAYGVQTQGEGSSRRTAEQQAAKLALEALKANAKLKSKKGQQTTHE